MKIEEILGHMEDNIGRISKILQHKEEKNLKYDDVGQGTHRDKNSAHVEIPSINKNDLRGLYSNMGHNKGWSIRYIQLPKIDMRKFDAKHPITWIF